MSREIPNFLRKHGIVAVTNNVPEGAIVMPPKRAFKYLLMDDLMEAWRERKESSRSGKKGKE